MPQSDIITFNNFLNNPKTSIPIQSQWVLQILKYPEIIRQAELHDDHRWYNRLEPEKWSTTPHSKHLTKQQFEDGGCIFANSIDIPEESLAVEKPQIGNQGNHRGFIPASIANGRNNFNNVTTAFLETNISFIDFIIRPWVISVAHRGLIATPPEDEVVNLKTTLKAAFFMKDLPEGTFEPDKPKIRKVYTFYNAAPINVSQESYSYEGDDVKYHAVEWTFSHYTIRATDTGEQPLFETPKPLPAVQRNPTSFVA